MNMKVIVAAVATLSLSACTSWQPYNPFNHGCRHHHHHHHQYHHGDKHVKHYSSKSSMKKEANKSYSKKHPSLEMNKKPAHTSVQNHEGVKASDAAQQQ